MGNAVPSCASPNQVDANEERGPTLTSAVVSFANGLVHKKARPSDGPTFDQYELRGSDSANVSSRTQFSYQTSTEGRFLKPREGEDNGRKHRPAASIQLLDPVQVAHALLEQAEVLTRQETIYRQQNLLDQLENLLHEDDDDDDDDSSTSFSSTTTSSSIVTVSSSDELEGDLDELDRDEGQFKDDDSRDVFSNLTETTTTDLDSRLDGGRSLATRTVLTTGTAATQHAKNLGPASAPRRRTNQRKEHRSPRNHGGRAGSSERDGDADDMASAAAALVVAPNRKPNMLDRAGVFAATQLLKSQMYFDLSDSAHNALGKSYERSEERYVRASSFSTRSPKMRSCGVTPGTLMLLEKCSPSTLLRRARDHPSTPREEAQAQNRVQRHMSALYLKLPSRCAAYVKHHPQLKRLLPANPVSRALVMEAQIVDGPESPSPVEASFSKILEHPDALHPSGARQSYDFDVLAALSSSSTAPAMQLLATSTSSTTSFQNESVGKVFPCKEAVDFGTRAGPSSSPVRMWVTGQVFLDLALTGSLGWVGQKDGSKPPTCPRQHQASFSGSSPPILPNRHLVLLNRRSFVPLVVCRVEMGGTKRAGGPPIVGVYATKRRFSGQDPAATTRQWGLDWTSKCNETRNGRERSPRVTSNTANAPSLPLYSWAKIMVEGSYPNRVQYSVFMARESSTETEHDGFEASASYIASHESFSSPELLVLRRTGKSADPTMSACAVVSLCHDGRKGSEAACADEEDDIRTRLSVSNGTDPALMVCLAAVIDESMEKSLRIQSRGLAEAVYRRNQKSI